MALEKTEQKTESKSEKKKDTDYGDLDGRWQPVRTPSQTYVLPLEDGGYVVHDEETGKREEIDNEEYLSRGYVPVSPNKAV
jgi:hypothetical protein